MAIAFTARASIGAVSTTVTTASFTPAANSRLFAIGGARPSTGVPPVITDSLGGTWTLISGSNVDFGNVAGSMYYRDIGASPAAMTVTATSTGATQVGVQAFDVTGYSTDLSNFQTNTNAAGDPSVTLATPAAASFAIAAAVINAGGVPTAFPTGYSQVYQSVVATNLRMCLYTDAASAGATQAWVSPGTDSICFGLEIKEAGAVVKGMKVWGGAAWAMKPVKVWTGSVWATKPVKAWNGSAWI
jgi:hypothetical protein